MRKAGSRSELKEDRGCLKKRVQSLEIGVEEHTKIIEELKNLTSELKQEIVISWKLLSRILKIYI